MTKPAARVGLPVETPSPTEDGDASLLESHATSSPGPPPPFQPHMSPVEHERIDEILGAQFGLNFPAHKRDILEARLWPRLIAHGLRTFADYLIVLEFADAAEIASLRQAVTNNETYFFRETHQFEALFAHAIEGLASEVGARRTIRILSVGCSSGEEPYTLGFFAKENQFRTPGRTVEIEAIDLNDACIAVAERAVYGRNSLRAMSPEQIQRYLTPSGPEHWQVKPAWRAAIHFASGNAMQLGSIFHGEPYDVVFCRNMLIYFTEASIRRVIANIAASVRPGGLLFLGHSESIIGMVRAFEALRLGNVITYKRVSDE